MHSGNACCKPGSLSTGIVPGIWAGPFEHGDRSAAASEGGLLALVLQPKSTTTAARMTVHRVSDLEERITPPKKHWTSLGARDDWIPCNKPYSFSGYVELLDRRVVLCLRVI